jgi:hypothetical protein
LTDKHKKTILNNNTPSGVSKWQEVKQGAPQGSILGPLLFLVYINDLPYSINKVSKPILFADDSTILCYKSKSNELVIALKEILGSINVLFSISSLTLNLTKTNCVQFLSKPNSPINININHGDTQINNTSTLKFLGLTMDSTKGLIRPSSQPIKPLVLHATGCKTQQ